MQRWSIPYTKEEQGWIWLSSIPGIGAAKFYGLLDIYKTPHEVWRNASTEMRAVLSAEDLDQLLCARSLDYVRALFARLEEANAYAICRISQYYPPLLREIHLPPPVLYAKGKPDVMTSRIIGVVGTRRPSKYGLQMAARLSGALSKHGVTIISGLARGIDSAAHEAALRAGGVTVAVLGCGVDVIYPPENDVLYAEIVKHGLVLSEHPLGVQPISQNFPTRNRIISGSSDGVLIVEAAQRSGASITVNYANDQGRTVFAVPGNVTSLNSYWPNKFISDGACLTVDEYDILNNMGWNSSLNATANRTEVLPDVSALGAEAVGMVERLAQEDLTVNQLIDMTGFDIKVVSQLLTILESEGLINRLPGNVISLSIRE